MIIRAKGERYIKGRTTSGGVATGISLGISVGRLPDLSDVELFSDDGNPIDTRDVQSIDIAIRPGESITATVVYAVHELDVEAVDR